MDQSLPQARSQIQVIARAAAILRTLENQAAGLSLGQIAQRVNLARSTVQRIVAALQAEKLLIAASPNGRVRLGPTIQRLAASASADFVSIARPFLVALSNELKETVDLATIKGDHLVFVDQVTGPQRLRAVSAVGEAFPLHCTANGKAYLAAYALRLGATGLTFFDDDVTAFFSPHAAGKSVMFLNALGPGARR